MSTHTSAGIDYGMGRTNIDHATGIRYGVISQNALASWFFDEWEAQYGEPTCPKCGDRVADTSGHGDDEYEQYGHGCADYVCHSCKHTLDSQDVYSEEPIGHELDSDGIKAIGCLDTDVMVLVSPFYTYGPYCSPCVPGGVSLPDDPDDASWTADTGARAYCFDHTWFEEHKAPYRVFRVADDSEVLPE